MPGRASSCSFDAELMSTRSALAADPLALCAGSTTNSAIAFAVTLGAHAISASATADRRAAELQSCTSASSFSGSSLSSVVIHSSRRGSLLLARRLRTCTCRSSFCRNTACLLCGKRPSPGSPRPFHCRARVEPAVHFSQPVLVRLAVPRLLRRSRRGSRGRRRCWRVRWRRCVRCGGRRRLALRGR